MTKCLLLDGRPTVWIDAIATAKYSDMRSIGRWALPRLGEQARAAARWANHVAPKVIRVMLSARDAEASRSTDERQSMFDAMRAEPENVK